MKNVSLIESIFTGIKALQDTAEIFSVLKEDYTADCPVQGFDIPLMAYTAANSDKQIFSVCRDEKRALRIAGCLESFSDEVYYLGKWNTDDTNDIPSFEIQAGRADAVSRFLQGKPGFYVCSYDALMGPSIPDDAVKMFHAEEGTYLKRERISEIFVEFGLERADLVEDRGYFAIRGDIIDIFPWHGEPVRIDLFDEEVESIFVFDPISQRSVRKIPECILYPQAEIYDCETSRFLFDEEDIKKFRESCPLLHTRVKDAIVFWDGPEIYGKDSGKTVIKSVSAQNRNVYLCRSGEFNSSARRIHIPVLPSMRFSNNMSLFFEYAEKWKKKYKIVVLSSEIQQLRRMRKLLESREILVNQLNMFGDKKIAEQWKVLFEEGFSAGDTLFITDEEIFGEKVISSSRVSETPRELKHFTDINNGDYVVHMNHGIGIYRGIQSMVVAGKRGDFFEIDYAGNDKLFVPVEKIHFIQKYIGNDENPPTIYSLAGNKWQKARQNARKNVEKIARDLLRLYAVRKTEKGFAFAPDTLWQDELEAAFPYTETPDQMQAIEEVKRDMESPHPMDRLICGDVGYGKTEVALRAVFKAVNSGKQAAVLVPTTILAFQHYNTFAERFKPFPVRIEMISRLKTAAEQKKLLEDLKKGKIDVLIGTHRLLSEDILFQNLGLLVIDEEQRFGVKHKEKIKSFKETVDVITMTATPIPRTLHMSLVGARDMSVINTAPENRLPIKTKIIPMEEDRVCAAIHHEISRGGQVYYVHNRIASITGIEKMIKALLPSVRIASAHGKMSKEKIENIMLAFLRKEYDVLISTTIIESGIDIPNVNTIIIDRADRLGLSQLYQLRGRVGRSDIQAYAYLIHTMGDADRRQATRRLLAIREHEELGSGIKIAMKDLEIRGAGNLLGKEQHGNIASVGFEMYCHLLKETVDELKGVKKDKVIIPREEVNLNLGITAHVPDAYAGSDKRKIEIYKIIVGCTTYSQVADAESELTERFGKPGYEVTNLLMLQKIRILCSKIGISLITRIKFIKIVFTEDTQVDPEKITNLIKSRKNIKIYPTSPPSMEIHYSGEEGFNLLKMIEEVLWSIS